MLTSNLLASISHRTSTVTTHAKDASIFELAFQPTSSLPRSVLKKSSTPPHALAASSTHIFAAQSDKAALHVYARDTGQHQTLIPLREKATALRCAHDGALVLWGTDRGALLLWETHSGRVVRGLEAHLGAVTALALDRRGTYALTGGEDGAVLVWNLPAMLGFGEVEDWKNCRREPVREMRSAHKGRVVDMKVGHGLGMANAAFSAGEDGSVIVWDYREGTQLRTILLPEAVACLALDPCDRGLYCGFKDGSAQAIDFMAMDGNSARVRSAVWDEKRQGQVAQVGAEAKWRIPSEDIGAVLCSAVNFDGSKLLTGHESGNIVVWDIPTERYSAHLTSTALPGPVSNIHMLEVNGFATQEVPTLRIKEVVKPRFGDLDTNDGSIPENYKITARLVGDIRLPKFSAAQSQSADQSTEIERALYHPALPPDLLAESIADLEAFTRGGSVQHPTIAVESDFMALDDVTTAGTEAKHQEEVKGLKEQIAALKRLQSESFVQIKKLREENQALASRAQ